MMIRYLLTVVLLTTSLFSANLNWSHDYEKGLSDAKKEHKLVYTLITSDSCGWCRKFESTTLQDKEILKRLHREFILIHLSRDRDKIPKEFETAPIPRHYFTDAKGNILFDSLGHRSTECFNTFMNKAQSKVKSKKGTK